MSNLEFVKFQNLYIRVADNLVTGIIFPHSGQFTHLLQNEELLEGKFSYLAKNEGLLNNFILQLNYILSKKGLTERSLYEALSNAYPTGSSDMTPIQVSVSENVPPPYPPGYAVRVEYALEESTVKEFNFKDLYVQAIDNKVSKLVFPLVGKYTGYLKNKENLNKFILQLNYLYCTLLTEDLLDKALENSIIEQGNSSLIPKQIEFESGFCSYLVNVGYVLFPEKLNFDLKAVIEQVNKINPYITWSYRFSLGIDKYFQFYTEWKPEILLNLSFPANTLSICCSKTESSKEFKHTVTLKDSSTESIIEAIKELSNLRLESNNYKLS